MKTGITVIELFGIFNAGKFTIMSILATRLYQLAYKVHSIQLDRSVPASFIEKENYLDREMFILMGTINEIIRILDASKADFCNVHRGPWDAIAYFRGLIKANLITKEMAKPGILLAESYINRIDLPVLVEIPVQVSIERSYLESRIPREQIKDENSLKALVDAYKDIKKELPTNSLVLDGTRPVGDNVDIVLQSMLSLHCESGCQKDLSLINTG